MEGLGFAGSAFGFRRGAGVLGEVGERRADNWPQGEHITWTFPGNDRIEGKELALEWFDGQYFPPEHIRKLASPDLKEYPPECSMLIGTEGSLLIPLGYPPQLLRRLADRQVLTNRPLPTLKELYPGPELPPS